MKALTICQPDADLIVYGVRRIENRSWPTRFRGQIAIHAWLSRRFIGPSHGAPMPVLGAVVGTASIVDCRPVEFLQQNSDMPEWRWTRQHDHLRGPYCFIFANAIQFDNPIPWKGAQGFWDFPDDALPKA